MITLLDGSCGSLLWAMAEAEGIGREPTWKYNLEQKELVFRMHRRYVEAGCHMIQTNTFAANPASVSRSSEYSVGQVVSEAVSIAKSAAGDSCRVYLSSGPMTQLLKPFGPLSPEECAEGYREIFSAASGVDAIMLETFMDLEMLKISAVEALKIGVPVVCSMSFEKKHRTLMGNRIGEICSAMEKLGVSAVGMNCSKGPVEGLEIIKEFSENTALPLYFKPNAGMGEQYGPKEFAAEIAPALPYVSYIGGCCGTDESYIKEIEAILPE